MDQKTFNAAAAGIFAAIAVLHGLRLIYGWDAVIGGWAVPMWLSWAALLLAGFLGYSALQLRQR